MDNQQLFQLYQTLNNSIRMVREEIRSRNIPWQHLAVNDLRIEAIIAYREKTKCSLTEAKDGVESFLKSIK
jgi:ribosomal protein L7/L12